MILRVIVPWELGVCRRKGNFVQNKPLSKYKCLCFLRLSWITNFQIWITLPQLTTKKKLTATLASELENSRWLIRLRSQHSRSIAILFSLVFVFLSLSRSHSRQGVSTRRWCKQTHSSNDHSQWGRSSGRYLRMRSRVECEVCFQFPTHFCFRLFFSVVLNLERRCCAGGGGVLLKREFCLEFFTRFVCSEQWVHAGIWKPWSLANQLKSQLE